MPHSKESRRKKIEAGMCYSCLARPAEDGLNSCRVCRPKLLAKAKKSQKKRRDNGGCFTCGLPAAPNSIYCVGCSKARNSRRASRKEAGLCLGSGLCPNPPVPGIQICEDHWWRRLSIALKRKESCTISPDELRAKWNSQGPICPLTGDDLIIGVNVSVDHAVPMARGGLNELQNLRFVTTVANWMKRDMLDEEFFSLCAKIAKRR